MHAWSSGQSSVPTHCSRLSSSLPLQTRMNRQSASSFARAQYLDSVVYETTPQRPSATFNQVNGIQRPFQLNHRRATSAGNRATPMSQPVVVRTYSAGANAASRRQSVMSRRSNTASNSPVPLPPVEDFSIEGVLRAIEPDIRSTIDAIAEICGRSKLSLANEYGSHRPPLGEIRAPSNALLTVEEASSSTERLAGENVLVVGDDISTLDGREHYSSMFGLLEPGHFNTGAMDFSGGASTSWEGGSHSQRRLSQHNESPARDQAALPSTTAKRTRATSDPRIWSLCRETEGGTQLQSIQTQPFTSEVHLDVEASHHQGDAGTVDGRLDIGGLGVDRPMAQVVTQRLSLLSDLQGWLEWFKNIGNHNQDSCGGHPFPSAETKLRAVLQKHNMHLPNPAISA